MQNKEKLVQSWNDLFPTNLVEEFNLDTPQKRSVYFMGLWDSWEGTEISLKKYKENHLLSSGGIRYSWYLENPVKVFAQKYNIREFWEYQLRGDCVRFKDENLALIFRLTL